MIIPCPSCHTQFELDPAQLGAKGRQLQCGKCAHQWWQNPSAASPAAAITAANQATPDLPKTMRQAPLPGVKIKKWGLSWDAYLAFCVLILVTVLAFTRDHIAGLWPPAARFYQQIGLPVATLGAGLSIDALHSRLDGEADPPLLELTGALKNNLDQAVAIPNLKVILLDEQKRRLLEWTLPPPAPGLGAGESIPFIVKRENPPTPPFYVVVRFTESKITP
ncbi:MAG: DUF3426 domain-containing protein [Dongiaceae bacterium]